MTSMFTKVLNIPLRAINWESNFGQEHLGPSKFMFCLFIVLFIRILESKHQNLNKKETSSKRR